MAAASNGTLSTTIGSRSRLVYIPTETLGRLVHSAIVCDKTTEGLLEQGRRCQMDSVERAQAGWFQEAGVSQDLVADAD